MSDEIHPNIRSLVRNLQAEIDESARTADHTNEIEHGRRQVELRAIKARAEALSAAGLQNEPLRVALRSLADEAGIRWQPVVTN